MRHATIDSVVSVHPHPNMSSPHVTFPRVQTLRVSPPHVTSSQATLPKAVPPRASLPTTTLLVSLLYNNPVRWSPRHVTSGSISLAHGTLVRPTTPRKKLQAAPPRHVPLSQVPPPRCTHPHVTLLLVVSPRAALVNRTAACAARKAAPRLQISPTKFLSTVALLAIPHVAPGAAHPKLAVRLPEGCVRTLPLFLHRVPHRLPSYIVRYHIPSHTRPHNAVTHC